MSGGSSFFFTTDMTREESPLEIRPKYLVRGGFGTRSSRNSRASRKWTSKKWILDCTRLAHVTTCLREQPFRSRSNSSNSSSGVGRVHEAHNSVGLVAISVPQYVGKIRMKL